MKINKTNIFLLIFLIILDALIINISIIVSFLIRFHGSLPTYNFQAYKIIYPAITLIHIIFLYIFNLYKLKEPQPLGDIQINLFKAISISIIISMALIYIKRDIAAAFPTTVFMLSWILNILLLFLIRLLLIRVIHYDKRVVIVGGGEESKVVATEILKNPKWGYKLIGYIGEESSLDNIKKLGGYSDMINIINKEKINEVIITNISEQGRLIWQSLLSLPDNVRCKIVPGIYESLIGRIDNIQMEAMPFIELNLNSITGWNKLLKRTIDIVFSIVLIILLSIPLIFISLLIKLTSKGSIFYKQERVGKGGKIFYIYKFRTMYEGAEDKTGPVLATKDDKRITKVGRLLRDLRLDELPQLFNILKGEMSLVGPRPERPYFVNQFKDTILGYEARFKAQPGLTGLAQINSAYDISAENKLKYDLLYIRNYSLSLDFKILLKTLHVVLSRHLLAH